MSLKAIAITLSFVALGVVGFILFFSAGSGRTSYVRGDAVLARDRGEHLLNRRHHTTDRTKRAELLTKAIEQFKLAIELKPDFEVAYNMLGHSYMERGQWEDSLKHFNKALSLRENYPAAMFNRGKVYQHLSIGKRSNELLDKAIADYRQAMKSELAANFIGDLRKALADAYHQKGEIGKATEELKEYLKVSPHAPDATLVRRKIRGLTLMEKGTAPPLTAPLD